MTEPCDLSATEARRLIGRKALSPVALLESCLARIEATNPRLNALVAFDTERARMAAKQAERAVMSGEALGPLHGLPIGIKDLEETAGLRTTFGSLIYKDHVPAADSAMVANVRNAGGIVLAKTNTPEFGTGGNTRNRVYGATGNPFSPDLTCAGSSGGSAVALATGMVPLATGSDFGGSLRTPAGFCGVVGFRPSAGPVPTTDRGAALMPFGVHGPMGRTVADMLLLFSGQIGRDERDVFTLDARRMLRRAGAPADLSRVRAAISPDLGCAPVSAMIRRTFAARTAAFRSVFASADDAAPDFSHVHDVFEVLRGVSYVASHGERLARQRDLLDRNVIDNTERGLVHSAAAIAQAFVEQGKLHRRVVRFFEDTDVLIVPAASVTPFPHSQLFVEEIDGVRMPTYMRWLAVTYAPTMALCCSCVLPCGVDEAGMPFGIQLVGRRGDDARVLSVALALEAVLAADPATRRPLPDLTRLAS